MIPSTSDSSLAAMASGAKHSNPRFSVKCHVGIVPDFVAVRATANALKAGSDCDEDFMFFPGA